MSYKVTLVEVGARDGLQNEKKIFPTASKLTLIQKLYEAGLRRIEAGSFVSPKWVPQMADSPKIAKGLSRRLENGKYSGGQFSFLVPNQKGLELAKDAGIQSRSELREIAVFGAASETFSKKNINCSIKESFARFTEIIPEALSLGIKVRGYLSTCFYCPYEGRIDSARVVELAVKLQLLGVHEISIGDTIGAAAPGEVRRLLKDLIPALGGTKSLALHFHDTRGTALANILASLDAGVTVFDSSISGLGGCPYAPGAAGNVATEDVVYLLESLGVDSGIDLKKLLALSAWLSKSMKRASPSRLSRVGLLKI